MFGVKDGREKLTATLKKVKINHQSYDLNFYDLFSLVEDSNPIREGKFYDTFMKYNGTGNNESFLDKKKCYWSHHFYAEPHLIKCT